MSNRGKKRSTQHDDYCNRNRQTGLKIYAVVGQEPGNGNYLGGRNAKAITSIGYTGNVSSINALIRIRLPEEACGDRRPGSITRHYRDKSGEWKTETLPPGSRAPVTEEKDKPKLKTHEEDDFLVDLDNDDWDPEPDNFTIPGLD